MQCDSAWVQCSNQGAKLPTPWQQAAASGTYSCARVSLFSAPLQAVGPYLNAEQVLADILTPISSSRFFNNVWEQRPLFISRPSLRQLYSSWLSEDHIFELLSKGISDDLKYGHNLDVTRYIGTVSPASAIWHALQVTAAHSWSSGCNIAGP